jgi:hypothetical protein
MNPQPEAVRDLVARLDAASGARDKAAAKRSFCEAWQISASSLSRLLLSHGMRSHARADRGVPRKQVPAEALDRIMAYQCASHSLRKGDIMPARVAIHIAEMNEEVPEGEVSASWLNRYMRERRLGREQRKAIHPHIRLASVGPNHVHQVDFSLATNWKMSKNGIEWDRYAEDDTKLAVHKAGEMRLWRMLVVDHATGVFFPYYGAHSGETVNMLLEGLFYAWSEKKIAGESVMRLFPFRGVPAILMFDRGSSTKSQITKNLLKRLGVETIESQGARAKGSVEVHNNIWEYEFESRMRLEPPKSIRQLNDWALDSAIGYCSKIIHSRTAMTRTDCWTHFINREEETRLRELRCDLKTFLSIALTNAETRLVRGGTFSFQGREYRVPSELVHSEKVWVQHSPFEYPSVQIKTSDDAEAPAFVCSPIAKNHLGFEVDAPVIGREFKSHAKSDAARTIDAARAAVDEIAPGALKVYGHDREGVVDAAYTPHGDEVAITGAEKVYSRDRARAIIREALGGREFTAAERAYLGKLGEQVTDMEIDLAITDLEAGVAARVMEFRSIAGGN